MNQLELATALSEDCSLRVDQNSISQMEKGNRFIKDFELVALAEALDKHPMWLLFGDKVPEKFKLWNPQFPVRFPYYIIDIYI